VGALLALGVLASSAGAIGFPGKSPARAGSGADGGVIVGHDYKHDASSPLREIQPLPIVGGGEHEQPPARPIGRHVDQPDTVVQDSVATVSARTPSPSENFDGIPYPGVTCDCAPPDTNGEVGLTQYVQIVNQGLQVFDKTTGASLLGPIGIGTLWSGFGGLCESGGAGDPVVLYDQLADRWLVSQFAVNRNDIATDECIAVSQTSDATGSWHRYGFHLGSDFFDYPKLGVWPDGYYLSANVFSSAGSEPYIGPQAFAFNRSTMLTGAAATFVSRGITGGPSEDGYLPSDLDGKTLPPAGAPNSFVEWPGSGVYKIWHFHADFATPANTTFTLFASPAAAGFGNLCFTATTYDSSCVPQLGVSDGLDALGDRFMFRLAYRNFGDHESAVTNFSVNLGTAGNPQAAVRWLELRDLTSGPVTVHQESTYAPDTTSRWMGSAAMDGSGDIAVGYSASSSSIFPQIRYAGRLATDPLNTLEAEQTLEAGTGSQTGTYNRWGDYSDMTVDPKDDCTFWYTNEYYSSTSTFNWRTRIGSFSFPTCGQTSPATIKVKKVLVPASDPGRFDLLVGTQVVRAAAGNGDSGTTSVGGGTYVVGENGAGGTSPGDYVSSISCAKNGSHDVSAGGPRISVTVAAGDSEVCTITNKRTGTVILRKSLTPAGDTGRFNLIAGGVTLASAVGDGGNGSGSLLPGTLTVRETAAAGTAVSNYLATIRCTRNGGSGPSGGGTSLQVSLNAGDVLDCTFANTRGAKITVKKVLKPSTDTGTFDLKVDGTTVRAAATNGGAGSKLVLPGSHSVKEIGANGTDLALYSKEVSCTKNGNADVSAPAGQIGVTVAAGDLEVCTIVNRRVP